MPRRIAWLALPACVSCSSEPTPQPAPEPLPQVQAIPGAQVLLSLDTDLSTPDAFFDLPYPSDLRLDPAGAPDVRAFPNPKKVPLLEGARSAAAQRKGFPVLPVAYFRFSLPLAPRSAADTIDAKPTSPILLLDVDETSSERGKLVPTVAATLQVDDYVPENVLGVAPRPGLVLQPRRKYAFVVMRTLGDADAKPLGSPLALEQLKAGRIPSGARGAQALSLYAPLWPTLRAAAIDPAAVAAATVFTTGDVVSDLADLSSAVLAAYDVAITDLHVDPDDGASHERYCELVGKVTFPQFQRGKPPYDYEGLFEIRADGLPARQRDEEAPVVIALPKSPMPAAGFPLALYFHGSGGLSAALADRGTWHLETDPAKCPEKTLETWNGATGCNTKGQGPAHVLAPHGIGMAGAALPVNPERLPGAGETAYLNFNNLVAFRDTFRQGVLEQRLLLEALGKLEIPPSLLGACSGLALPPGATGYRFATDRVLAQGQSMGGMYTNMVGPVEPRIKAAVPTGAGGFWSYFILQTTLIPGAAGKVAFLLAAYKTDLTFLHPGMHLFETAVEPADPIVYMPRLSRRPLAGHAARSVYEPVGKGDSYFPTEVYDAVALAYGHPQAGSTVWPSMQQALALDSLAGLVPYPVRDNLVSSNGARYTGVVVQYEGDGVYDPHALYTQRDEVKYQYGCFFATFLKNGSATVPAPAPLGTPCPD